MRTLLVSLAGFAVIVGVLVIRRVAATQRADRLANALIWENRFVRKPGHDRFDQDLAARTTQRRDAHARLVDDYKRELDKPPTRLHRAS